MRAAWFSAGAVLLIALGACSSDQRAAGTLEPEGPAGSVAQAVQCKPGEEPCLDTTHKYAVGVCAGNAGNCFGICSGALITPNVVVTARHCVDQTPQQIDCTANPSFGQRKVNQMWITTNSTMGQTAGNAGWYQVKSIAVPNDDHICGHDLAVLVLNNLVPSNVASPIIPGVQYPMYDNRYLSQFTAIGYGNTGPNQGGAGTRRIRQGIFILCTPGDPTKDCPPEINTAEFVAGDGTCSGDSGSSAYEQLSFEKSTPVSFGVLSRGGESADGTRCEGSIYTRLDAFRDLVVDTATQASNNWTLYEKPAWTIYIPPDGKKDAGADDASTGTKPSGLGLGATCQDDAECSSQMCRDEGDGSKVCTKTCDANDSASCPEGYSCREQLCLPDLGGGNGNDATTTTTTSGCAASPGEGPPLTWAGVLGAAFAVAAARRRRRA